MQVAQHLFLRIGYALFVAFGKNRFRSDTVHPDAVRTNLGGEVLGEDLYPPWQRRKEPESRGAVGGLPLTRW